MKGGRFADPPSQTIYDDGDGPIVVGDIRQPAHDYRCETCAEIFIARYSNNNRPIAVLCPVCGSGLTKKLISMPAVKVWYKGPCEDMAQASPRFREPAQNKAAKRR